MWIDYYSYINKGKNKGADKMTYTVKKLNNFKVSKNTVILKGWGVIAEDGTLSRSSTGDCGYEVYNTKAIAQRVADFKNNKNKKQITY